jgi:4-amino-4-deoxy-L-arabinose transferase-like glycosyltransferase
LPRLVGNPLNTPKRFFISGVAIALTLLLLVSIITVRKISSDPNTVVLLSEQNAGWIRHRQPVNLNTLLPQTIVNAFRVRFTITEVPEKAVLKFRAMKNAEIFLDKRLIYTTGMGGKNWKQAHRVDLAPYLSLGGHEIFINVANHNGYPAVLAHCRELKLFTAEHWETSQDGVSWTPALPVDELRQPAISHQFERSDRAFISKLTIFLPLFIMVFILSYLSGRGGNQRILRFIPEPGTVRWVLILLFAILGANNAGKIAWDFGMDAIPHLDYVLYVARKWRIPFADEGWKMFESPLYYILSAILYKICSIFYSMEITFRVLRVIPLLCGALQIELCYRSLRYVYPLRKDLQILGTLIGGLLPMNIYMSQVVGSEPLVGVLSGLIVVLVLRLLNRPSLVLSRKYFIVIGFVLGLALLTKITAILLVPPLLFFLVFAISNNIKPNGSLMLILAERIGLVVGVAVIVCGWYYVRNWMEMGQIFVGGWDPFRKIVWWQDPGYRTLNQLVVFGASFSFPIYSGVIGIWDSLYSTMWADGFLSAESAYSTRPLWNYGFMISSTWFAALPMAAIMLGILRTLRQPIQSLGQGTLFAASCVIVYLAAILYLYITVPIYSVGKASYMLGLLPCFALLAARGMGNLIQSSPLKEIIYGIFSCWAVSVYIAYFVY